MQLKILGSVSPYAHAEGACPSYLVCDDGLKLLLDCGSGSHRFFDMKDGLEGLNIIISHLHRDHYNDIFNYLYASFTLHNLGLLKDRINIYLPDFPQNIYLDIINEKNAFARFHTLKAGKDLEIGGAKVSFIEVEHSKDVKTFATKIQKGGQCIVYSGDISYIDAPKLARFAQNADILLCESSLLCEHGFPQICNHLTARQAGTIARQSGAKALVLTHFWPEEAREKYKAEAQLEFGNVILAKENMQILVGEVERGNGFLCREF